LQDLPDAKDYIVSNTSIIEAYAGNFMEPQTDTVIHPDYKLTLYHTLNAATGTKEPEAAVTAQNNSSAGAPELRGTIAEATPPKPITGTVEVQSGGLLDAGLVFTQAAASTTTHVVEKVPAATYHGEALALAALVLGWAGLGMAKWRGSRRPGIRVADAPDFTVG
jgi:hypothetical protein